MHKELINTNTLRANIGVRSCLLDCQRMQGRNKEGSVILDPESEGIFGNRISGEELRLYYGMDPF